MNASPELTQQSGLQQDSGCVTPIIPQTNSDSQTETTSNETALSFENESVDLLCTQERYLRDIETSDDVQVTVASAFQMLTAFLSFAVRHFNDGEHGDIEAQLQHALSQTQSFESMAKDEGWKRAGQLLKEADERESELSIAYNALRQDFAMLHAKFFLKCVGKLHGGPVQIEFLQAVDLFLNELKRKW